MGVGRVGIWSLLCVGEWRGTGKGRVGLRMAGRRTSRSLRRAPMEGEVVNRCGCGPDRGPMRDDEGPSEADIERFSSATRACPDCKSEVYDDAEVCWKCGHTFGGPNKMSVGLTVLVGVVVVAFVVVWVL